MSWRPFFMKSSEQKFKIQSFETTLKFRNLKMSVPIIYRDLGKGLILAQNSTFRFGIRDFFSIIEDFPITSPNYRGSTVVDIEHKETLE